MKTKTEPAAQRHPTAMCLLRLESNEKGERKTTRDTEPQAAPKKTTERERFTGARIV